MKERDRAERKSLAAEFRLSVSFLFVILKLKRKGVEMLVRLEKMSRWRRQKVKEKEKKAETIDAEETREKKISIIEKTVDGGKLPSFSPFSFL